MLDLKALSIDFEARFGRPPELAVQAPGRVNLIGEHTDYNAGLVLPLAIDRRTVLLAAQRDDGQVCVASREFGPRQGCEAFALASPERQGSWVDYVQASVFALGERGLEVGGLDLLVASDVPGESGLSSSAALGVAVATAFDRAFGLGLAARDCAELAHRGESEFVGVGCGVMDQFASALGRRDHALRLDCRSLETDWVPLPGDALRLLVAHSGVTRKLAQHGYADRRRECEAALAAARQVQPEAEALRDFSVDDLAKLESALDATSFKRARHVILENQRVDRLCEALLRSDFEASGEVLREGMRSLRDDFEVSCPELDVLCETGDALPSVYGSRLTGAGFGGCTLHLVAAGAAEEVSERLAEGFEKAVGRKPPIFAVCASDGAGELEL